MITSYLTWKLQNPTPGVAPLSQPVAPVEMARIATAVTLLACLVSSAWLSNAVVLDSGVPAQPIIYEISTRPWLYVCLH